jgi:hypothetical protein
MVGRAALGDPWIFSGASVPASDAAAFLLEYHDGMSAEGTTARGAIGCVKQLVRYWTAGDLFGTGDRRTAAIGAFVRESDPAVLLAWLRVRAGRSDARKTVLAEGVPAV